MTAPRRWLGCAAAAFILLCCKERTEPVKQAETVSADTGSTTSPPPEAVSSIAAATPVPVAAPAPAAPPVPAGDVAAMAATDFGSPSTRFEPVLHVQRWAQDGGGHEAVNPSGGHRFLVVEFPRTATQTAQIFYDSRQVFLHVGQDAIKPYAVTTGGASAPGLAVTADGRRVFQREVYVSFYAPTPTLPFAVAFLVPDGTNGGTLKLGSREAALSW